MFSNVSSFVGRERPVRRSSKFEFSVAMVLAVTLAIPSSSARAVESAAPGTLTVDANSAVSGAFNTVTVAPSIAASSNADWPAGTTFTLTAPTHFVFDTTTLVSAVVTTGDLDLFDAGALPAFGEATPAANTIVFTVTTASTIPSTVQFPDLRLRAVDCVGATAGPAADILLTVDNVPGAGNTSSLIDVAIVDVTVGPGQAGAPNMGLDHFDVTAAPLTQAAGSNILVTLTARDLCNNAIPNFSPATPITLTATGGAGVRTYSNGTLTVTPTVANTATIGIVNVFDSNGQGTFNVVSPLGEDPAITLAATLGAATGNVAVHWITATCTGVAPATDTNLVGTNHTVTATIQRNGVNVADGTVVNFTITAGPNAGGPFARPTAGGVATFMYTSNGATGIDTITATGLVDGISYTTACTGATKEWITTACNLTPPTDSNQIGTNHTVTATVLRNGVPVNGINVTFSITAGPNTAVAPQIVMTAGAGTADFMYTSNGTSGTDTIQATGLIDGVPFTCTATKTWLNAQCLLLPAADTNPVGTSHTVTVTVSKDGVPVGAGQAVNFEITSGPNAPQGPVAAVTDIFGQATFTYTDTAMPAAGGTDTIRSSGTISGVPFECFAVKTWVNAQCSISPPADTNQVGTDHTVTATILRNGAPVPDGTVVNFDILPGSPNVGGPFPRLVSGGGGAATFTYIGGLTPGTDIIRASGVTVDGVPFSCTAAKTWINVACSLNPPTAAHLFNTVQSVTATVSVNGVPVGAGVPVNFEVLAGGANFGVSGMVNTIAGGTATFNYTGTNPGLDTIRSFGSISGVSFECTATKEWVNPSCSIPPSLGPKPRNVNHTVTTTLLRRAGVPALGELVTFNVISGPNAGVASAPILTNASGQATFTYLGANAPTVGNDTDTIQSSATVNGQLVTCSTTQQWIESGCALDLVAPVSTTSQVGTQQTVRVTVNQNGSPVSGVQVTFAVAGVNAAVIPDTPAVVMTNGSGQAFFSYTSNGTVGNDTISASGMLGGVVPFNCAVAKTWVNAQCNLVPLNSTNQIGTLHTVTGTVRLNGIAQAGVPVTFDVTAGPNAAAVGPTIVMTDVNGEATFSYTGNGGPGTDTISATGSVSGVPFSATANKTWVNVTCTLLPATDTNPVNSSHTVTARVKLNGADQQNVPVTFDVIAGPNAAAVGPAIILTNANGEAAFVYNGGPDTGTDTIQATGTVSGVTFTQTASKTWITATCNVTPLNQQAPINANASVTVTVLRNGVPATGVPITFVVTGTNNSAPAPIPTNASGQATLTYLGGPNTGTDNIAISGSVDGVALTCTAATVQRVDPGCMLTPATDTNQLGTNHTVTVHTTLNGADVPGIMVGFEVVSGPNVGDTGFGFTNAQGRATFTYTGDGGLGDDVIQASGLIGGLPFTCTAMKTWINAACSIDPPTSTSQVGGQHTATVTVTRNGLPASGVAVTFTITAGPNIGQVAPRVTNGAGQASFLYVSNGVVGTDSIQVTGNVDGVVPILCTATKTWINAACSLTPATDTNKEKTQHTATVTVTRNGAPASGINVAFSVTSGPNNGLVHNDVTNASGQAAFTYTGAGGAGTDTIQVTGLVDGVPILCTATKIWQAADNNGIDPNVEDMGPNNGDGNSDGIPDSLQPNVATLPDINGNYVTIVSPPGTELEDVKAIPTPAGGIPPPDVIFPVGFFSYKVTGVPKGGAIVVTMILHSNPTVNTFYKFGPTPIIPVDHFYSFLYDGTTGAEIAGKIVTLHFVDGQRGDHDLAANGVIVEPGAPALQSDNPAPITALSSSCGLCGPATAATMPLMVFGLLCLRWGRTRRRFR